MAGNWATWLLANIGKAWRWRGNTPDGGGCAHDCEGGVDVPLSPGTPIYALATGPLLGKGTFNMGSGGFGHSVVTQEVAGTGKLYYQHLDALASIPDCVNGACNGYVVQQGQLLGYSNADIGEVEIGINPAWGGIWGPPNNGASWVLDPRKDLVALANSTDLSKQITPPNSPSGNCPDGGVSDACCKNCQQFNIFDPRRAVCLTQEAVCMGQGAATDLSNTATAVENLTSVFSSIWATIGPWLGDPVRMLKLIGGAAGLVLGVLALFWPTVQQASQVAVKETVKAGGF